MNSNFIWKIRILIFEHIYVWIDINVNFFVIDYSILIFNNPTIDNIASIVEVLDAFLAAPSSY